MPDERGGLGVSPLSEAKKLGRDDCASAMQRNLDEKKAMDQKLNELALSDVNQKAA